MSSRGSRALPTTFKVSPSAGDSGRSSRSFESQTTLALLHLTGWGSNGEVYHRVTRVCACASGRGRWERVRSMGACSAEEAGTRRSTERQRNKWGRGGGVSGQPLGSRCYQGLELGSIACATTAKRTCAISQSSNVQVQGAVVVITIQAQGRPRAKTRAASLPDLRREHVPCI